MSLHIYENCIVSESIEKDSLKLSLNKGKLNVHFK